MTLIICGIDINELAFALVNESGGVVVSQVVESQPDEYYSHLKDALDGHAITSIVIVDGQGSPTALRNSATIANTLSFLKGIPVQSVAYDSSISSDHLEEYLNKKLVQSDWVVPNYERPPNITQPK